MYRETAHKGIPLAVIIHVSNPDLFHRAINPLTRHLLVRHRLLATLAELRFIRHRPAIFRQGDFLAEDVPQCQPETRSD